MKITKEQIIEVLRELTEPDLIEIRAEITGILDKDGDNATIKQMWADGYRLSAVRYRYKQHKSEGIMAAKKYVEQLCGETL